MAFTKFFTRLLLLAVTIPVISSANDILIDPCKLNDVIRIQRPIHPEDPTSPTFQYAFRYIQNGDANLPVIIYLPGGPGQSSITESDHKQAGFNYIWTDPRGIGCNANLKDDVDLSTFSTANLASDILAMINSLKLKKYILHGHSYGTVLATEVAARAGNGEALFPPTAVVLVGTLGQAFNSSNVYKGSQEQWSLIKRNLPHDVLDQLSANDLPFGVDADRWGRAIVGLMVARESVSPMFNLGNILLSLQSKDPIQLSLLKSMLAPDIFAESSEYSKVSRPIWCRELAETDNTDVALINGELIGNRTTDYCKGFSMISPYDSKDWQITAPLFYFQGAKDNLTTLDQAQYHYFQQKKTKRFFVTMPEDSHSFPICKDNEDALWRSIAMQGQGFKAELSHCSGSPQLEISDPL